jgi:hypothetical protein
VRAIDLTRIRLHLAVYFLPSQEQARERLQMPADVPCPTKKDGPRIRHPSFRGLAFSSNATDMCALTGQAHALLENYSN